MQRVLEHLVSGAAVVVENPASEGLPGFIVVAAEHATADTLVRVDRYGFGHGYLALSAERSRELELRPTTRRRVGDQPNQLESIDARTGIRNGLSADDRAHTIRLAASHATGPSDFVRPGHVLPLAAEADGTLRRPGATEAAVDLVALAGSAPAAVIWPLLADDGAIPRASAVERFSKTAALPRVTVDEIVARRWRVERAIEHIVTAALPTRRGTFQAIGYHERVSGDQHMALVHGQVAGAEGVLTSHHEECVPGAALRATRCRCRARLDDALARTAELDGVLIYSQVTRPTSWADTFTHADEGGQSAVRPTRPLVVEHILKNLGVRSVRWLGEPRLGTLLECALPVVAVESYDGVAALIQDADRSIRFGST